MPKGKYKGQNRIVEVSTIITATIPKMIANVPEITFVK
jgi:hypothetical protein